jgi:hypothetical protein
LSSPPAALAALGAARFDDFLYASVVEDSNGMPLTVLSLLARLNVDPWEEAARLAQLPGEDARVLLTTRIAALPTAERGSDDSGATAARLVALLPRRVPLPFGALPALPAAPSSLQLRPRARLAIYVMVMLALVLGEWLLLR